MTLLLSRHAIMYARLLVKGARNKSSASPKLRSYRDKTDKEVRQNTSTAKREQRCTSKSWSSEASYVTPVLLNPSRVHLREAVALRNLCMLASDVHGSLISVAALNPI